MLEAIKPRDSPVSSLLGAGVIGLYEKRKRKNKRRKMEKKKQRERGGREERKARGERKTGMRRILRRKEEGEGGRGRE